MDKDLKKAFESEFQDTFEEVLPQEFTDRYTIVSCLSRKTDCDTLLVLDKESQAKYVAKCYCEDSAVFYMENAVKVGNFDSDAIPKLAGEYQNEHYRVLMREYVEGTPLSEYVVTHPMTESEMAELAIRIVRAMQLLHTANPVIVHRDIKPQNVVVKEDGSIALIDFGISRVYKEDEEADTIFCGTEGYAPPEQYGFMQTDIRSDIYSFGILLAWMLTGQAKPVKEPDSKLAQISARCTSFAPENRYKDDEVLIFALQKITDDYRVRRRKKRIRRMIVVAALTILFIVGGVAAYKWFMHDKAVQFKEPLIEEAVRLQLDKPYGDITYEELKEVRSIYIFEDYAVKTEAEYYEYAFSWGERGYTPGEITDISDLKYMPNLENVFIGGEPITSIEPLEGLDKLVSLECWGDDIEDISPLAGKQYLNFFSFNGNNLKSIEAIRTCPALKNIGLGNSGCFDGSPIADITDPLYLNIACDSDAYNYLSGMTVDELDLGAPGQTDIDCIKEVEQINRLYIYYSEIRDISALENREDIRYFNMRGCRVEDLSPLFTMPNLRTLEIDYVYKDELEALAQEYGEPGFEIIYGE